VLPVANVYIPSYLPFGIGVVARLKLCVYIPGYMNSFSVVAENFRNSESLICASKNIPDFSFGSWSLACLAYLAVPQKS